MLEIVKYEPQKLQEWESFVSRCKNSTFLHLRSYMDYHADRFHDHSLMIYDTNKLIAILPANLEGDKIYSHGGLTYGGLLIDIKMTLHRYLGMFKSLLDYLDMMGIKHLIYKRPPAIYHSMPADEDLYACQTFSAKLLDRKAASVIYYPSRISISSKQRPGIKKAKTNPGLHICEWDHLSGFYALLESHLSTKFNTMPVHSYYELSLLMESHPLNIKLHVVTDSQHEVLAGAVIYSTSQVAHCQYLCSSKAGKDLFAPQLLYAHLIEEVYADKKYFDFGTSRADGAYELDLNLVRNKESFGARTVVYEVYGFEIN